MRVSDGFDSGNIMCRKIDDTGSIDLEIRQDNNSDFYQWFHFRLTGARNRDCVLRILNAGGAAYPKGWEDYQAVASYDRDTWFRVATTYRDGVLTIRHRPDRDAIHYAYFAPYSMERHHDLIAHALEDTRVRLSVLGSTLDGQDMDLLSVSANARADRQVWIIARQHPGETMAEWFMEGLIDRLLDRADPVARALLDQAVVHLVPNMNPDGSRRGHLRTNAVGTNLNRAWDEPTMDRSPEVFLVRQAMDARGLDFCLDVHGDETLPHNYLITPRAVPSWTDKLNAALGRYRDTLAAVSPDFQPDREMSPPDGKANLSICSSALTERFQTLALTLEQPFKDVAEMPDRVMGWSPARARALGRANLDAILATLPHLPVRKT